MGNVHASTDYAKIATRLRNENTLINDELEFKCEGTSMNPVLKEGDEILVRRIPFGNLRFGDIITYEENGIFITHRFLYSRVHKNQIVMMIKADDRLKLDKPVLSHFLVGKVIGISRKGKKIEIESRRWSFASRLIALLSLMESWLYEIILSLKRAISKHLKINEALRQRLNNYVQKPKRWLLRFLLLMINRQT